MFHFAKQTLLGPSLHLTFLSFHRELCSPEICVEDLYRAPLSSPPSHLPALPQSDEERSQSVLPGAAAGPPVLHCQPGRDLLPPPPLRGAQHGGPRPPQDLLRLLPTLQWSLHCYFLLPAQVIPNTYQGPSVYPIQTITVFHPPAVSTG